jgi:two-component sensor histidine kinase
MKNRITAGTIKAFVFIFLVATAIFFWLSTQQIVNHVREFQKVVVQTQKSIFLSFVNSSSDEATVNSDIFREGFLNVPFPIIYSDENNNPLPQLWRNLNIATDDTSAESAAKLRKIISRMDRVNPPDTVYMPALRDRTDILWVYEMPISPKIPMVLTDQVGNILYWRNVGIGSQDTMAVIGYISKLDSIPDTFNKPNEPPLIIYGASGEIDWPIIITKSDGRPLYWKNVGISMDDTSKSAVSRLESYIGYFKKAGISYKVTSKYISGYDEWLFHYGDPEFLLWIVWLPIMSLTVIIILIFLGFIGFSTITKAEQRSIWVGMAKETAHQLGTPITSINGWLELLKTEQDVTLLNQAISEMERDLSRLTRVVSRFSHIGSIPELQPTDVSLVVKEIMDYFRIRVPNMGKHITLETKVDNLSEVMGNSELLNWAFENLVKNSLASIETNKGLIRVTGCMSKDFKNVILDFSDNGKGIPSSEKKKIMKPGYTTKKRGWGLGLSLVKRIIEEYHGGRIYLLDSQPGIGSTFRIILPSIKNEA